MKVILVILLISSLIQISYWIFFAISLNKISNAKQSINGNTEKVSIIISLKNEAENITSNFESWITSLKEYDELILVDDFSSDDSFNIVSEKADLYPQVKTIRCSKDRPGKKQALIEGIAAAQNEIILLTDADCVPGQQWRTSMVSQLDENIDLVLGYAPFFKRSGWLNRFQRFECLHTAIQYLSYAKSGHPYMGVGRNLLYRKHIFEPSIFSKQNLASGDDDLLVSAKANSKNTSICIHPDAFVYSTAPISYKSFIRQKTRHISSSTSYKVKTQFFLALYASTQILSNISFLILLLTCCFWLSLIAFGIKQLCILFTLFKASRILSEEDLPAFTPFLDLGLSIYYLLLSIVQFKKDHTSWN